MHTVEKYDIIYNIEFLSGDKLLFSTRIRNFGGVSVMFQPDYHVTKCPICGAALDRKQFMGYGITSGYNSSCPNCGKYNDIWACGMREVDCGNWHSDTFHSNYGTPTDEEAKIEKQNFNKLNRLILLEKIKWIFQRKTAK